jgi:hypothetical protein
VADGTVSYGLNNVVDVGAAARRPGRIGAQPRIGEFCLCSATVRAHDTDLQSSRIAKVETKRQE